MRIIERYILKSVLSIFTGCLLVFFFLYIVVDIFSHLDEILKQRVIILALLEYYLSFLPMIFVQVAPIASLLSVLYTFGALNRNNEIIALRSSGLSIYQITRNVIVFGAMVAILIFYVNDKFVPQALSSMERTKEQMESGVKKEPEKKNQVLSGLSMYGQNNRLYFINKFDCATNTMEGVVILEQDKKQNITKKIVATQAKYEDGLWVFYQSMTYNYNEDGQAVDEPVYFEKELMTIPETPTDFLSQRQRPELMTTAQLKDYLQKLSKSGATTVIRNLQIDLYQRYSMPLTIIVSIMLAIPFSLKMKKRATGLSSVGISIMIGFVYYVFNAVCPAIGKAGVLTPVLAVSLSHILGFFVAIYMIRRIP